ncbi:tripartite tricarboxylate transporter TctB family protein [Spiribacter halobius]|uniref:DUF1468 domain-containing protein n=1 Tax=Sediminicurvatus halobius TaxID=2182432 RepID=A0A2U2N8D7_9GAMM|nr:tripartite tricarboxylate transporter TctB family protein [Spiribacter halobius]PWG65426.1 hypothetical protein DEM34_01400 [Spiribacter halobius]UEX76447.1 tripartite tricarboxylate transporter TctB family protein [Spiribacter halobius]
MSARTVNTDIIAGLLGVGVWALFWFARGDWTALTATWPNAVLVFILIASLGLLLKALLRPERRDLLAEGDNFRKLVIVAGLIAWAIGIRFLGFVVTSVVVFLFLWWFIGRAVARSETEAPSATAPGPSWLQGLRALAVTLIIVLAFYWIFRQVLYVPLPSGVLI